MTKTLQYSLVIGLFSILLASGITAGVAALPEQAASSGKSHVISALGIAKVQGQDVLVEILVEVQQGQDPSDVARQAIQAQGARPFDSANLGSTGFTLTEFVWDKDDLPVVQNYNPGSLFTQNEPFTNAKTMLEKTHTELNSVATSNFKIISGDDTDRCPSIVDECPGLQFFDGNNDVAWLALGPGVLGVTWFGTNQLGEEETDMALSTEYTWSDLCSDGVNIFNAQSVFLHENVHVAGLGHSDDTLSVMQPFYHGPDCDLGDDDIEGITFLYDNDITGSISGTVMFKNKLVNGATVLLEGTSLKTTTDANGEFLIEGIPDPVTYDIKATNKGKKWEARITVDGDIEIDIKLSKGGGGDDDDTGGKKGGPPACHPKRGC